MPWIDKALELLTASPVCGYQVRASGATEPTALAALALVGHGRLQAAEPAGEFLVTLQAPQGYLGVRQGEDFPRWPTSLAMLAWQALAPTTYQKPISQAVVWTLSMEGERMKNEHASHNSMLAAWPWVDGTHSWIEPSALFTVALKSLGMGNHPRTREAVTMLLDRLLPAGGCNYGNTVVLGQVLRPHVQPSGMAMLALQEEAEPGARIPRTLRYLTDSLDARTTSASLAWGLLGLAAHQQPPAAASQWLEAAFKRTMSLDRSPYKIALLALAALGSQSPLVTLPRLRAAGVASPAKK